MSEKTKYQRSRLLLDNTLGHLSIKFNLTNKRPKNVKFSCYISGPSNLSLVSKLGF